MPQPPRRAGSRTSRGGLLVALLLSALAASGQDSAESQARRLLEDGRTYWKEGKFKQALDSFSTIVTGFGGTESAPAALLEIGRYRLQVEGSPDKARAAFEDVSQRFPQSPAAPGAYYYLGYLTLGRASTPAELDDALAQFTRVQHLYSRSDWVPRALYASGLVHRKANRLLDAVDAERRVALEYPSSDAAPEAQFEIGHCLALLGDYRQSMEEFQRVRNHFPDSDWAARALRRITALYRLYGGSKPSFAPDPQYSIGSGDVLKEVRGLLSTPEGTVWVASGKARAAVPFDPAGKMGPSLQGEDVRGISLSPRGDVVLTTRIAVRIGKDAKGLAIPSDKPGIPEPLEHLEAAAVTLGGALLASDDKKRRVYRFDGQFQYQGTFPDAKERSVTRLLLDSEGGIVMLDREEKAVRVFDEAGHAVRSLALKGSGYEIRHPTDVAVDAFRNTYVAEEDGGVYVFTPSGQLLVVIGSGEQLRRPRAIAVDASGALLAYDDKAEKILRFK